MKSTNLPVAKIDNYDPKYSKPNDRFMAKWTVVDCVRGKEIITISFYKNNSYCCHISIKIDDTSLVSNRRGSTKSQALDWAFKSLGIHFDPELYTVVPHGYTYQYTPMTSAINAILKGFAVENFVIVKTELEPILDC